jgi:quercetin dioxygenase-like cupin family protein
MTAETIALAVNPSDETLTFGPLVVRFLLTGDHSTGSVALFELTVRGGQRLPAPAHSHDHYEETIYGLDGVLTWTVDGKTIDVAAGHGALYPARRGSPVRQSCESGREGAVCDHAGRDRAAVFP